DSTVIAIPEPYDSEQRKAYNHAKSPTNYAIKVQIACDFRHRIVHVSECYQGSVHDITVLRDSGLLEHVEDSVQIIGDKGYIGEEYVVTPRKKPHGCELTNEDKNFNRDINSARTAIENINQLLKTYAILGSIYRGAIDDFHKITKIVQVVSALCNMNLNKYPILIQKLDKIYTIEHINVIKDQENLVHILKFKDDKDANEAKALSSSKVQLEDNAKDILKLERTIADLQQQKCEQYNLLKRALTEEDRRKHSQQTVTKEPSWTSLYSPNLQMAQYSHHPQHYLSAQPSHRLLAYKPPPPPPSQSSQSQSFIPTTTATNVSSKRPRSPSSSSSSSSHIYPSPSGKSSRSSHISQMHSRATSPGSRYPPSSSQVVRNGASGSTVGYPSSQTQSNVSFCCNKYLDYLNPLSFLPQQIVDPNQQQANVYSHHQMLMSSKNESIMNGYSLQSQQ
ncbi:unnamed protein product, partial [Rotaria sordida]